MIYRSNLTAPDLYPQFKHVACAPQPGSFGHDVITHWTDKGEDWAMWKKCGSLTHDEAAILYNVANRAPDTWVIGEGGGWLDIGANVGWTTAHISEAGSIVLALDPMFFWPEWVERFRENMRLNIPPVALISRDYFGNPNLALVRYDGVMIDGDHGWGNPLYDAQQSAAHLKDTGVIVFHDFIGGPVQEAVVWLMDNGFKARVYYTPFMMAVCWRGNFTPPDHRPDPNLPDMQERSRSESFSFPFERLV
jgi:hypothetical protein